MRKRGEKMEEEEKELCESLEISLERKREIDSILMETHRKYLNGEIKTMSLEEFKKRQEQRVIELEKLISEQERRDS